MVGFSLNRIRILKTGLANVQDYIDIWSPADQQYFEKIATPGTQLKLKRIKNCQSDPFRIEVYSPDNRLLGRVTVGKNETAARMMDAGLKLVAIVNPSLPVHDSDMSSAATEKAIDVDDMGWTNKTRKLTEYCDCNLPYSIYFVDE